MTWPNGKKLRVWVGLIGVVRKRPALYTPRRIRPPDRAAGRPTVSPAGEFYILCPNHDSTMASPSSTASNRQSDELSQLAAQSHPSIVREFVEFLACNKKWWLAPILVVVLLVGLLVVLGGTGAAPFIYTLF